jgi:hypothetical protein
MTKYNQTTINLPQETKRKVRLLAAEMGISIGKAALRLIELGLEDHLCHNKTTLGSALIDAGKSSSERF